MLDFQDTQQLPNSATLCSQKADLLRLHNLQPVAQKMTEVRFSPRNPDFQFCLWSTTLRQKHKCYFLSYQWEENSIWLIQIPITKLNCFWFLNFPFCGTNLIKNRFNFLFALFSFKYYDSQFKILESEILFSFTVKEKFLILQSHLRYEFQELPNEEWILLFGVIWSTVVEVLQGLKPGTSDLKGN